MILLQHLGPAISYFNLALLRRPFTELPRTFILSA
jgi:hypothetical protein